MRAISLIIALALILPAAAAFPAEQGLTVRGVRSASYSTFTRIVFEIEAAGPYVLTRSQDGRSLMLGAYDGPFVLKAPMPMVKDGLIAGTEPWEEQGRTYVVIRLADGNAEVKDFTLRSPDRIVLDIRKTGVVSAPSPTAAPMTTVVELDPGHGGKDAGLMTGQGLEKTFDLEMAAAIRRKLAKTGTVRVLLTRERDQTLALDERAAIANAAHARIFVSIHASADDSTRVYIQDLAEDAGTGTASANPPSGDFLGYETGTEMQESSWGKQQAQHAQQSGQLGRKIARSLTGKDDAEPAQAPIAGLRPVDAAAVLVEISMTRDREQTAEQIVKGIEQYATDLR